MILLDCQTQILTSGQIHQAMDIVELDRIISLLHDDNYKSELIAFRRSYQRLKIRLRNNRLNGQLKQLRTLISRLEVAFPVKLFEKLKKNELNRKTSAILLSYISQFIRRLDDILQKSIVIYCKSQPHFRVGHLVQHYLVVRASLARLTFCFKALLVYSSDLYLDLSKSNNLNRINLSRDKEEKLISCDDALAILNRHNCVPKQVISSDSPEILSEEIKANEQIGQLIDRSTLRPVRACRKTKAPVKGTIRKF